MPRSAARSSGSVRVAGTNGATPSGSGSMPSASAVIVALPASAISYTSRRSTPASAQTSPASSSSVACAAAVSRASASGSSIVALIRVITSAPKGCWRLSIDPTATGVPVARSSSVATTVVVPRSNAMPNARSVVSPGSTSTSTSSTSTAVTLKSDERNAPGRLPQRVQVDPGLEVVERREQPFQVAELVGQPRLGQLDDALLHGGAQDDLPADADGRGLRPGDQRRHLDLDVALGGGQAGEPPARAQLVGIERPRVQPGDRQLPVDDPDLALAARSVPAAGRVDRDAVPARGVEQGDPGGHADAPLAGVGGEGDRDPGGPGSGLARRRG